MTDSSREFFHALGNHLNAAILLGEDLNDQVTESSLAQLSRANELLSQNKENLPAFFSDDQKAELLVAYYLEVEFSMTRERDTLKNELALLNRELAAMRTLLLSRK